MEDNVKCSSCKKEIKLCESHSPAMNYFQQYFCDECWEEYKENNSRRCKKCGYVEYECLCD